MRSVSYTCGLYQGYYHPDIEYALRIIEGSALVLMNNIFQIHDCGLQFRFVHMKSHTESIVVRIGILQVCIILFVMGWLVITVGVV